MSGVNCTVSNPLLPEWNKHVETVEKQFLRITNPERTKSALHLLELWMQNTLCGPQWKPVFDHVRTGRFELLLDSFHQFVPFGTGGRRGRVGFGPNRINDATVSLSVQGHCRYLRETFPSAPDISVVVAYDVRIFKDILGAYKFIEENPLLGLTSKKLARIAAEIYAAHGIRCYFIDPANEEVYLSTPELSFDLRRLGAQGGVNMSASHNHPDDNGFKFYNVHGAQDIPPYDEALAEYMNQFEPVSRMPFEEAWKQGLIVPLPPELHEEYLATNLAFKRGKHPAKHEPAVPITYTPLCGTGRTTVEAVLRKAGHHVVLHEPDADYDGTFPHIPFHLPNPEVPEAAWPAIETAEKHKSSVVFSTDPDADRLGVLTKDPQGRWRHLSGNEIASILSYYMILDQKRGPNRRGGLVIKTLVTTSLVERIAAQGGCTLIGDLLIGFKFIAEILRSLEAEGRYENIKGNAADLILAVEESHGYLLTPKIRDKDAAGPALMLGDLVYALAREGMTLPEYLQEVTVRCGNFGNGARNILMTGIRGAELLRKMMASLRATAPDKLGAAPVIQSRDFQAPLRARKDFRPETSMAKANDLLEFRAKTGRVIVRPSGTEPKIKIYSEAEVPGTNRDDARRQAAQLALEMFRICIGRLGPDFVLSGPAEHIPDHIPLDVKKRFDTEFTPQFFAKATELDRMDCDELNDALKKMLTPYVADDPMQVFRTALLDLCHAAPEIPDKNLARALSRIAAKLA